MCKKCQLAKRNVVSLTLLSDKTKYTFFFIILDKHIYFDLIEFYIILQYSNLYKDVLVFLERIYMDMSIQ
jgi:hypothetical protein